MADLYQTIGVSKTASRDEIQKAYRKLARKYHPDVNRNNPAAEKKFKEVTAAYEVISDENRRKWYDEFGEESLQSGFDQKRADLLRQMRSGFAAGGAGRAAGSSWDRAQQRARASGAGPSFDFSNEGYSWSGGIGDIFEEFLGAGKKGAKQTGQIEHRINIDFKDAVLGGKVDLILNVAGGNRKLKVSIPAGTKDGSKILLSAEKTGIDVDLVLLVSVKEHRLFKRDQDNLIIELPVKFSELIEGASIRVPTLTGEINIKVPAGSQSGTVLRAKGKGVITKNGVGDLLVKLNLVSPDRVDHDLIKLAKQFDAYYSKDPREDLYKN